MAEFIQQNAGSIIIGAILLAVVAVIVVKMIRDRRAGKSSCGCGCEHCSGSAKKKSPK